MAIHTAQACRTDARRREPAACGHLQKQPARCLVRQRARERAPVMGPAAQPPPRPPRGRQSRAPPRPSTVLGARRPLAAARSAGARRCRQRRSRRCRWRRESCRGRRAASHVSGRVARARCVRGGRATVKEMERWLGEEAGRGCEEGVWGGHAPRKRAESARSARLPRGRRRGGRQSRAPPRLGSRSEVKCSEV